MTKKVFFGKIVIRRIFQGNLKNDFIVHGNTGTTYAKLFKGFAEKDRIKVIIEKITNKAYKKEVYGDPRG